MRRFGNVTKCISCMAVALMLCVMSGWFTQEVFAEKCDGEYEDFEYYYGSDTNEVTVYGYNGEDENVVIPETIDGRKVTGIDMWSANSNLKTLSIPAGVDNLLLSITAENFEAIYVDEANQTYKSINGLVYTKDGKMLIKCPSNKGNDIVIEEGTEAIHYQAILDCYAETVTLPSTLKSIYKSCYIKEDDTYGYMHCELKDELESALPYTETFKDVYVNESNDYIVSIDGMVYTKDRKTLVACPNGKSGEVTVYDGAEIIGVSAFGNCEKINKVNLGDKIREIKEFAFSGSFISDINIPDSCTIIGDSAFKYCENLTKLNIPAGVTELARSMFMYSGVRELILTDDSKFIFENGIVYNKDKTEIKLALESIQGKIVIPDRVEKISQSAFSQIKGIDEVVFPDSLTYIGENAFRLCTGINSINIPENVTYIGKEAFRYDWIRDILVNSTKLEYVGENAFDTDAAVITVRDEDIYNFLHKSMGEGVNIVIKSLSPSIKLNKTKATIYSGNVNNTVSVKATLENITGKIKWTTSDKSVATVSNGKITAVGKGTATIKASIGKTTAKVVITVKNPTVTVIDGSKAVNKINVKKAKTVMYKVKVNPAKSKLTIVQDKKSKQMAKVTLKNNILSVKGLKKGSTEIKIKCGAGTKKMKIIVR